MIQDHLGSCLPQEVIKNIDSKSVRPTMFKSWLCYLLAALPYISYLIFLCPDFHICKIYMIVFIICG